MPGSRILISPKAAAFLLVLSMCLPLPSFALTSSKSQNIQSVSPQVLGATTSGLVGYWSFDEGSGTTAADSSGSGNNGTLVNGPVRVAGKVGSGALRFDGANDYVNISNEAAFDFTTQFTVSLWMKTSGFTTAWSSLVSKGDSSWSLTRFNQNNTLDFNTFSPAANDLGGSKNVSDNVWHHVAIVYNGSSKILYVDGQVDASASFNQTLSTNNYPVRIGGNAEFTSAYFSGTIDEVSVYNRGLSAAEITDVYQDTGTDITPPTRINGSPSGSLPENTTTAAIELATGENAVCRYDTQPGIFYGVMNSIFSVTGNVSHSSIVSGLVPGNSYSFYVRCMDAAGNTNNDDYVISFSVLAPDITAPSVPQNLQATAISPSQVSLAWNVSSDNVGVTGYQIYRNGSVYGSSQSLSYFDSSVTAGQTYTYSVSAYDAAGNTSALSSVVNVTVPAGDTTLPTVSITSPSDGSVVSGSSVAVTASAADNTGVAGVSFFADGILIGNEDTVAPYSATWNFVGLSSGIHTLSAQAHDTAGNVAATGISVAVDNEGPEGTLLINGGSGFTTSRTATLSLSASDRLSAVTQMRFSNTGTSYSAAEAFAPTKSWTLTSGNGIKTVYVQYKDAKGNWSPAYSDSIVYDTVKPTLSGIAASDISSDSAKVNWTSSETATSRVEYGLTTFYGQSTPLSTGMVTVHSVQISSLAANTLYNYRVRSMDAAGNEAVGANKTFKTLAATDTASPTVSLTEPVYGQTVAGTINISASASDNVSVVGVQFLLDGQNFGTEDTTTPYQVNWDTTLSPNGSHILQARARDAAGNTSNSVSVSVDVFNVPDTEAPSIPSGLSTAAAGADRIDLSWNAAADNVGVAGYRIFRSLSASGTFSQIGVSVLPSYSDTGLSASTTYYYTVAAEDNAGNISGQSAVTETATWDAMVPTFRLSADGKYLIDPTGNPAFINGDAAWSLIAQVSREDVDFYLTDRSAKGYNLVMVNLMEHYFSSNPPANYYGAQPFTVAGNFSTPNETYFEHVDWVLNKAREKGITMLLAPMYLGYACGNQGWCPEVRNNSSSNMRSFGRFVGERYKDYPNIIWLIGGDTDPVVNGIGPKMQEFVAGIKEYDSSHLMTAHNNPEQSAMDVWSGEPWLDLNNVYTYGDSYPEALAESARTGAKPLFLLETYYENEHSSTPLDLRRQAYNAVLSGANMGHIFGNCPTWAFGATEGFCTSTDWKTSLNHPGAATVAYAGSLFRSRAFHLLIPDRTNQIINSTQKQSGTNFAGTARTSDGSSIIVYLPTRRTVSVNLTQVSGAQARAWWYNPRTGASTFIGTYLTTGSQSFTSPDANDWVLVMDNAEQNLPAPGMR